MGALLQDWFTKNIWDFSKRSWTAGDNIFDINGNIIHPFYASDNAAGELVTPRGALKNATVYSSVNVRGNTIASLPIGVFEEKENKKNPLVDHPAYWVLSQEPNSYTTGKEYPVKTG